MWVRLEHRETSHAVCFFPPVGSSRKVDTEERFQVLEEQVNHFKLEGQVVVCGDFNSRCGGLSDVDEVPARCCVDLEKNGHGELIQSMRSSGLV